MMVLDDLKDQIPLREISRISGISLSGYYYKPVKRHVQRLDPSTRERIRVIASERPTYGYRRVWAVLRNQGTKSLDMLGSGYRVYWEDNKSGFRCEKTITESAMQKKIMDVVTKKTLKDR